VLGSRYWSPSLVPDSGVTDQVLGGIEQDAVAQPCRAFW